MIGTLPDRVPSYAEELDLLDHIVTVKRPSQYAPGRTAFRRLLVCPSCQHETDPLPLETITTCPSCGLLMCANGMLLRIWRRLPIARLAEINDTMRARSGKNHQGE